jgi:KaiC/GvpD/RAD55 family RecA-like ATPase
MAYKVGQGVVEWDELQTWFTSRPQTVATSSDFTFVSDNLEEIIGQTYSEQGMRWRLECLNKSLGSLRQGDFGFIFARPETGKTTFLASEVTAMLSSGLGNGTQPIIWLNNEEQGSKVMLRIYQAYFGVTTDQLLANPRKYKEAFVAQTKGRFKLFDSATISKRDVEKIIDLLNPMLVIYDQIDKIKGFVSDREDLRLGSIYQWARELAKGRHAAIGVCQADGTAEGVRYLTMDHVANAKTAKQAEADFILGIGKTHSEDSENVRFLNICKNKLLGDKDSLSNLRHGKFEVLIEAQVARYKDIVSFA